MDEKMEIRLVNPTEDGFLQKIDWNKAELEANVRSIVEAYQGLVYTEDTVSDAKNDRAALRKLLNEIEDRRKLVKKKCMEPYEVFENDLKDVTVLIKEQISIIDGKVKEYENGVKEEKKVTQLPAQRILKLTINTFSSPHLEKCATAKAATSKVRFARQPFAALQAANTM